mgnify:CR=1 FL=1
MRQDMSKISWNSLKKDNASRKVETLVPYLTNVQSVLDFGCGDLSMARALHKKFPRLKIAGIDVVDFGIRDKDISFRVYDGREIPFSSKSFDIVVAYHVFHHAPSPEYAFRECVRVARHAVIFVEPVYRSTFEIPGMIFMDWLFNVWKHEVIPMTYKFHSLLWWKNTIGKEKMKIGSIKDVELLPAWSPTGTIIVVLR